MSKPYTVAELYKLLNKAIFAGLWDKFIFTWDDVEWNGYHWLYFWLEADADQIKELDDNGCIENEGFKYEDVVILG